MEKMDKGLTVHCTKMGADSLAENTPNALEFICHKPYKCTNIATP